MLGPDHTILLSFMTVIAEESHEIVNHCYGKKKPSRNMSQDLSKQTKKYKHSNMVDFSLGCRGASEMPHLCSLITGMSHYKAPSPFLTVIFTSGAERQNLVKIGLNLCSLILGQGWLETCTVYTIHSTLLQEQFYSSKHYYVTTYNLIEITVISLFIQWPLYADLLYFLYQYLSKDLSCLFKNSAVILGSVYEIQLHLVFLSFSKLHLLS